MTVHGGKRFMAGAMLVMAVGMLMGVLSSCENEILDKNPVPCDEYLLEDGVSNWRTDVRPIIVAYCAECHRPERASGGIILSDFNFAQDVAKSGRLLGVIRHEPGYNPMPYRQPKLDSCSIEIFEVWVAQGALNN